MTKDTVNIHGKSYETVASRVSRFREKYGYEYAITTEIHSIDEKTVVMKASISSEGVVRATGYAEESRTSSSINRTSALENCETSAIGRALAAFGMAGTEYASADEVAQAIHQQGYTTPRKSFDKATFDAPLVGPATDKQREIIKRHLSMQDIALEDQPGYLIENYGVEIPLSKEGASAVIDMMFSEKGTARQTV
jgi:hypothetical protein